MAENPPPRQAGSHPNSLPLNHTSHRGSSGNRELSRALIVELAFHPQTRNGLSVIHLAVQCTCSVSSVMTGFLPENRSSEPSAAPAVEGSARNPFLFRKCLPSAHICRSEEHTSELQSIMRISSAVFCLQKKQRQP